MSRRSVSNHALSTWYLKFSTICRITEGKTIIMVEQNAKKGLEFADIGYVLVSGQLAIAGKGDDLLKNPKVGELADSSVIPAANLKMARCPFSIPDCIDHPG